MKTHYRKNSFFPLTAAFALLLNHATAVTGTWNVDANGLWSLDTNWASSVIADDLLSTANFTNNITADRTVSLDSDRTINRVNFSDSDTSSAGSWILDNNGTATNNLILSGTTGAASGTVPVIDVLAGKTATISAVIEGTYGFNKTSSGTLILTGNNTLSGSVSIFNGGKLIAGHNNAFGTATVTINNSGSTLELADGITLNNAITIASQANAKGIRSGSGSAAITGNITLNENIVGNAEIRVSAGGTLTLSGDISGNGFEKLDPGTIILTGTNTYAGGTQINGGIVDFANKAAKPATGTVTANASGSVGLGVKASDAAYYSATEVGDLFNTTLTGFSLNAASGVAIDTTNAGADFDQTVALTAARALTKLGTGTLILSQTNTYTGNTTVNAGTLVLADNAQLRFVLGATSGTNNSLSGAGSVTLDGDFVIVTTAADALASGTWTIENVSTLTGAYGANFTVSGFSDAGSDKWTKVNGSKTYTFDETTGILTLAETPVAGYSAWATLNGAGVNFNEDHDNDGVDNGTEYFIGGTAGNTTGFTPLPGVTNTLGVLSVTYTKAATYTGVYGTDYVVETSSTLADPWAPQLADPTPDFTVTFPSATEVKYTFPAGTKQFARLKVIQTP